MAVVRRKESFFVVHRDPATGRQMWTHCGHGIDGEKKAHALNDEMKDAGGIRPYHQQPPAMQAPTFATLANEYIKARKADMPKVSMANLFRKLKSIILPELGHLPATMITGRRLDQYIAKRSAQPVYSTIGPKDNRRQVPVIGKDGAPRTVKTTTIHRELTDVQAILNWAADPVRGYIAANPVAGYRKPRRDDDCITPPTSAEAQAIISHLPEHARRALVLSYYTGVRPGAELFGICWHDVDLTRRVILIRSAKKGGPISRALPIHDRLLEYLAAWQKADAATKDRPPYIILYKGAPVSSIKRSFITAKRKAGITRRLRLYDLRHAFATDLIESGVDIKAVSYMLGHSRPDTTARVYRHISMDALFGLINRRQDIDKTDENDPI